MLWGHFPGALWERLSTIPGLHAGSHQIKQDFWGRFQGKPHLFKLVPVSLNLFIPPSRETKAGARLGCERQAIRLTNGKIHTQRPHRHSLGSHTLWTSRLLCLPFWTIQSRWSWFWTPHLDCSTTGSQARKKSRKKIYKLCWQLG